MATRVFDRQLGRLPGGEGDPVLGHFEREVGFGMGSGQHVNEPRPALTVEVADDHVERTITGRGEVDLGVTPDVSSCSTRISPAGPATRRIGSSGDPRERTSTPKRQASPFFRATRNRS